MGAACGCMEAKSKGESRNGRNIVNNKGGVMIGGSNEVVDDVAAARAAKFGKKREEANNRGISKESQAEYKDRQRKLDEAERLKAEKGDPNMNWGGK